MMPCSRRERKRSGSRRLQTEEAARREKARKRKAVLKQLRRRAEEQAPGPLAKATPGEIADQLGAKSSLLPDIAALVRVNETGVEEVARSSWEALGQKAASASGVSRQIGRNISAAGAGACWAAEPLLLLRHARPPSGFSCSCCATASSRAAASGRPTF